MRRYSTTYSNGHTVQTSDAHEAVSWQNFDDEQVFRLSGSVVSAAEFYAAARSACDAAWDKKNQTHKRVRVRYGASAGNFVEIWVRR